MDIPEYGPCDTAYLIEWLRTEGELLAGAAGQAGLDAPVPACPGWRVRDLLKHVGYVHRWAAGYVGKQYPRWVDRASEEEILSGGPGDDTLISWFLAGHATLVRTLDSAAPDMTCWTFLEAPSPLAFWARRQAHETTIHRVDAQQAAVSAGAAVGGTAGMGAAGAGTAGGGTAGTGSAGTGAVGTGAAGSGAAGTETAGTETAGTGAAGAVGNGAAGNGAVGNGTVETGSAQPGTHERGTDKTEAGTDKTETGGTGTGGTGTSEAGTGGTGGTGTGEAGTGTGENGTRENGMDENGTDETDLDETAIAPRFAADGIDELIMGFLGREAQRGSWDGPSGILAFHADDGATVAHWRVAAGPGRLAVSRETGPADCHVTGPAADLYLLLWNRRGADGLDVRGDAGLLADFRRRFEVTWR